jgi:putative ABC transport system permease protein
MGTPTSGSGGDSPKAIAPLETGRRHMNLWVRGNNLIVKPRDGVRVEDAVDDVTAYLRGARGLRPGDPSNFAIVTQDKLMDIYDQLFGTFFVVGIALSSVGLLVGGIGVIAIMMISVTERTREIGVRKALGATRFNILFQFLVEALVLCLVGGILGIFFGTFGAVALSSFLHWNTSINLLAIFTAFVFSAMVGLFFGIWPARRAASMDPIVALRYE